MTTIIEQFQALSPESQYLVSEYFMDQLRLYPQNPAFFVKAQDFKNRLFEFVLTAPTLGKGEDGSVYVNVKGQLNHLVLPKGEGAEFKLVNVAKRKGGSGGQFNKGYYSPILQFNKDLIQANLITKNDLDNLVNYVSLWESNGDQNYVKGSAAAKQRLWLSARSSQGYMSFVLTERTDSDGNIVPALENVAWTAGDFSCIGTGTTENAQSVSAAPGLAMSPSMVPAAAPTPTPTAPTVPGRLI
jgi:hypothetical protein